MMMRIQEIALGGKKINNKVVFIINKNKPLTMTLALDLKHTALVPIRKHFYKVDDGGRKGIKDADIPYGERVKGDEDIEFWRRTDY